MAQHGGLARPHFNHDMEGSSIHNKISPTDGSATAGNQLPLRVASPRRMTGIGPRSAPIRRAGIGLTTKHLAGGWAITAVWPDAPPSCESILGTERVLMLDFTSTQALAKELAPPICQREARAKANSASTSPPLTADGLDRMYR
jgi:hypothetical protein